MPPSSSPLTYPPSETSCPHCHSPSIHTDHPTGDTLCTTCGIVLSSHHLSETPEWINYDNDTDGAAKQRVGAPVDETQWRGGIMPTTLGRVPYVRTGNTEENRRLGGIRRRLMKTHALVESMMDKEWKERYDNVVLETKVREAKLKRGEDVEQLNGVTCRGDYEELMGKDDKIDKLQQIIPLRDRKWVVSDAILLHGTLDEVTTHLPREEGGWTIQTHEKERKQLFKSLDATSRSTAGKLYLAFRLLYRAAIALELDRIVPEMSGWLVDYAKKRHLKVNGISRGGEFDGFSLSLLHYEEFPKKSNELNRVRQYASLGSAILYLCAKRNGKGRTLTEICGAFGTLRLSGGGEEPLVRPKYCSKAMQELRMVLPHVVAPVAATSHAPTEAAAAIPESASLEKPPSEKQENTVSPPINTEHSTSFNRESTSVVSLSSTSSSGTALDTRNHNVIQDDSSVNTNIVPSTESEALADLTSRLSNSLNLPPCAITASVAIAVQCHNDDNVTTSIKSARQIRPPIRRGGSSLFINSRGTKRAKGLTAALKTESSSDLIAAASILLVCMAGQKMQVLARQAVNNQESISKDLCTTDCTGTLSNALDDFQEEVSSSNALSGSASSSNCQVSALSAPESNKRKPSSIESWTAWNHQPPWHRDVSEIEQVTGVSSKSIISYYSNILHPRRSYFLDASRRRSGKLSEIELQQPRKRIKTEHNAQGRSEAVDSAVLLQNFSAAAPLMSTRGL